jgi:glucose-6-phosphate dehydrogenase assembly protein OpcA
MTANTEAPLRSTDLPLGEVERELSRQMEAAKQPGDSPAQRAHMSNLVIFCDRAESAAPMTAVVPAIVTIHPARILLLVGESGLGADDVRGEVSVWCQKHRGGPKVCCEQVTLHARGQAIEHLPFAVRGLLIGDLPTNVWWAASATPAFAGPFLYGLAEYAQQVIYDSIGWLEPARAVAASAAWLDRFERGPGEGRWRVVADLNWRRLKYWRRLLAQVLDPNTLPGALDSITEIVVEHGPHAVVQAWLLVSWLASRLGWQVEACRVQPGEEISWKVAVPSGVVRVCLRRLADGPAEVRHMRIACTLDGKPSALNVRVEGTHRLAALREDGSAAAWTLTTQAQPLPDLLGRQLSDRERDPVFRESMAVAQVFARPALG